MIIAGLIVLIPARAQEESINQEVRVVREYNPTVSDAFKINRMPQTAEEELATPVFNYSLSAKAMVGKPETVPLVAARMGKEPREDLSNTYFRGYVGNYNTIGGALMYNILHSDKYSLALKAVHESSLGEVEVTGIDEDAQFQEDAQFHESLGGLYFNRFFKRNTFSIDMDFSNLAYRYYGFGSLEPEQDYVNRYADVGSPESVPGKDILPEAKQRQTAFDIVLGLNNNATNGQTNKWDLNMGFSTFGTYTGVNENQFIYRGDFEFPINELGLKFETGVLHAGTNNAVSDNEYLYNFVRRQQTLVTVNPALVRRKDGLLLNFGLRIGAGFDELEDELYLSPDVWASYTIAEGIVAIEGGITGEIKPSTYRSIMEENPYVSPDLNVKNAFHGVKFFFGTKGNFSNATSFAARVEYSVFRDEHFYVNRTFTREPERTMQDFINQFDVDYDDGNLLTVSGVFNARFTPDLEMTLKGSYYGWKLDSLSHAWQRPDMEAGIRLTYRYDESLTLYGSFNVSGSRNAAIPDLLLPEQAVVSLDPVYDFNLGANYSLNKKWHFFGEVRNMLASKYNRWFGYPSHGINAIVGFGYSF